MTTLETTRSTRAKLDAASGIRSILIHVEAGPEASAKVRTAADLARRLEATLIGVGAEMTQALGIGDPFGLLGSGWVVELEKLVQDNLRRAEATFRTMTAGIDAQWLAMEAIPSEAISRLSRGADLIIAGGQPLRFNDDFRAAQTAELVLLSGRPVLVAPPVGGKLRGEAVVVAWKDTREARRAVADALPFLKAAEQVVVQEVCEADAFGAAEAQTFCVVENLKRHGVAARAKVTIAPGAQACAELKASARLLDADLIVAGAYGHSRLGEWMFGGVTHELLTAPSHFVLLSH